MKYSRDFILSHISAILIAFVLLDPLQTTAGMFSFVTSLLNKEKTETVQQTSTPTQNAQTIALLSAPLNADFEKARGGGDITIVAGSALLPESGPAGTLVDIEDTTTTANGQISLYVVREGDTLSQIATMFGVTTNTIIWANDIKRGSLIAPGETLVILPVSGVRHAVKKGDTLQSIAKKYSGDLDEIVHYNALAPNSKLVVGEIVTIPDGEVRASTPVVSSSQRTAQSVTTRVPSYTGYYMRPLTGGVRTQGIHGYNGVDIADSVGTPILAAASGAVIISKGSGWNGGYGSYVVIKHDNGTQTLYAHMSSDIVSTGQFVVQGQVIGYVGSTGKSTGPHLHFEVRGAKNPF
jgi:LysM repeat protein